MTSVPRRATSIPIGVSPDDPAGRALKILYVTPSMSRSAGGIFEIERRIAQCIAARPGTSVSVAALRDENSGKDAGEWAPLAVNLAEVTGPAIFGYAPSLTTAMMRADADLVHLHGIWMYPTIATLQWSRATHRPYIVTIHGMLDRWALRGSIKKKVASFLYHDRFLRSASCLHVNSRAEANEVRALGLRNRICVIPNGVDTDDRALSARPPWSDSVPEGAKVLLYLGRLHPKKGLANAIRAWTEVCLDSQYRDWYFVCAGWDQENHLKLLQSLANKRGGERIVFLGPQYGDSKRAAFARADAFILPSFSEGLPMAVLEAWAFRLPVIMTPACNLPEGFTEAAAISISPTIAGVGEGLRALFSMADSERHAMGDRGRKLVERRFTWEGVAESLAQVYSWILGSGRPPDSVMES